MEIQISPKFTITKSIENPEKLIPESLQSNGGNLWYFEFILFNLGKFVVWTSGCKDLEIQKSEIFGNNWTT